MAKAVNDPDRYIRTIEDLYDISKSAVSEIEKARIFDVVRRTMRYKKYENIESGNEGKGSGYEALIRTHLSWKTKARDFSIEEFENVVNEYISPKIQKLSVKLKSTKLEIKDVVCVERIYEAERRLSNKIDEILTTFNMFVAIGFQQDEEAARKFAAKFYLKPERKLPTEDDNKQLKAVSEQFSKQRFKEFLSFFTIEETEFLIEQFEHSVSCFGYSTDLLAKIISIPTFEPHIFFTDLNEDFLLFDDFLKKVQVIDGKNNLEVYGEELARQDTHEVITHLYLAGKEKYGEQKMHDMFFTQELEKKEKRLIDVSRGSLEGYATDHQESSSAQDLYRDYDFVLFARNFIEYCKTGLWTKRGDECPKDLKQFLISDLEKRREYVKKAMINNRNKSRQLLNMIYENFDQNAFKECQGNFIIVPLMEDFKVLDINRTSAVCGKAQVKEWSRDEDGNLTEHTRDCVNLGLIAYSGADAESDVYIHIGKTANSSEGFYEIELCQLPMGMLENRVQICRLDNWTYDGEHKNRGGVKIMTATHWHENEERDLVCGRKNGAFEISENMTLHLSFDEALTYFLEKKGIDPTGKVKEKIQRLIEIEEKKYKCQQVVTDNGDDGIEIE